MSELPYWQQQAVTRQRIITKQDKTILQLRSRLRELEAELGIAPPAFEKDGGL